MNNVNMPQRSEKEGTKPQNVGRQGHSTDQRPGRQPHPERKDRPQSEYRRHDLQNK